MSNEVQVDVTGVERVATWRSQINPPVLLSADTTLLIEVPDSASQEQVDAIYSSWFNLLHSGTVDVAVYSTQGDGTVRKR